MVQLCRIGVYTCNKVFQQPILLILAEPPTSFIHTAILAQADRLAGTAASFGPARFTPPLKIRGRVSFLQKQS